MSFFKKVLAGIHALLFKQREDEASEGGFPKIDPERIKIDLKIIAQARAQGAVGVPDASDTRLTETEHQIRGTVGKLRLATFKSGERWLRLIQARLDSIDLTQEKNRTVQLGDEFVRKADSILSQADAELQDEIRTAKAHKEILARFRSENGLPDTPAKIVGWTDHALKVGSLVICCAIESAVNSTFFASAMQGGLLEGLLLACLLAVVNIIVCFVAGRFYTNKNHVHRARRVIGFTAGLLGLVGTIAIGVFVAYCRYVMPQIDEETTNQLQLIWRSISALASPFSDLESIGLFIVTVLFGLIALHHGYAWSDRYPGYAKVYRAYVESYQTMIEVIERLRAELDKEKKSTLETIDAGVKKAKDAIKHFKYSMGEKSVAKKKVIEHLVLADNTILALTQAYRYENQMVRPADKPRPDYFNNEVVLDTQEFPDFGIERDEARLKIQEQMLNDLLVVLEPTRARVQSSFTQKFDQLKPLESQV
ncbi:hypothetical protein [Pseudomonas syringae]|uniref:Transmembrane protein n=1 Tax=Pseudomonas syringae TaxID=317 RepID=A0A085VAI0_PSESX|nr:hypothetical protein [Pseudomonas syringae]KFE52443.1 hypothetical protein IV02_08400 [Pseudomonas syringae]